MTVLCESASNCTCTCKSNRAAKRRSAIPKVHVNVDVNSKVNMRVDVHVNVNADFNVDASIKGKATRVDTCEFGTLFTHIWMPMRT